MMNKEELYKLALSDIHKYSLLNEIFAIRDERFPNEQQGSMLCVSGYIGLDVLNDYVDLQQRIDKAKDLSDEIYNFIKCRNSNLFYEIEDLLIKQDEILGGKK